MRTILLSMVLTRHHYQAWQYLWLGKNRYPGAIGLHVSSVLLNVWEFQWKDAQLPVEWPIQVSQAASD
jgi:hypothetical protein